MPGAFSAHLLGTHRIAMVRSVSRHIRYVPIAQLRYVHPGRLPVWTLQIYRQKARRKDHAPAGIIGSAPLSLHLFNQVVISSRLPAPKA